jgi:membrane-associated protease RseP (regulator of RpoE activity)
VGERASAGCVCSGFSSFPSYMRRCPCHAGWLCDDSHAHATNATRKGMRCERGRTPTQGWWVFGGRLPQAVHDAHGAHVAVLGPYPRFLLVLRCVMYPSPDLRPPDSRSQPHPDPSPLPSRSAAAPTLTLSCPHAPGRLGVTMSSEHSAGALVCAIEKHSRADRAGLRLGDAILSVNGVEASTAVRRRKQAAGGRGGSSFAVEWGRVWGVHLPRCRSTSRFYLRLASA